LKQFSFVVRDSKEEDLTMLVDLKRISEQELNWEPPEEYLEEFLKIVRGIYEIRV
jgi:hypothetical protein